MNCSKQAVSRFMRISWNTVGPMISRVRNELDTHPENRFDNLEKIGIDETSYRKGHKYMTVVVNHDTEELRTVFKLDKEAGQEQLNHWIKWAQHCRIPAFVELQRKIQRHYDAILSTLESGISNARIEAVNNKESSIYYL